MPISTKDLKNGKIIFSTAFVYDELCDLDCYSIDNSILNNTSPVIYRKGKIMYHLDLPYREMCDSDHYSVCTEISQANHLQKIKADAGKILRELCKRKGVTIIEEECCPDHIRMVVEIPPHMSVASFMGCSKNKSSLKIFDKHANQKYKYGNRHIW